MKPGQLMTMKGTEQMRKRRVSLKVNTLVICLPWWEVGRLPSTR